MALNAASAGQSHKPRRRRDKTDAATDTLQRQISPASQDHLDRPQQQQPPQFPLAAFLWPARRGTSQWIVLPLILMFVGLYRWATSLWPYSGYNAPPMHGDFEAQRHWMELTRHLPITQWYFHDLDWWGLDYPPLTAYHSWFIGLVGDRIDPRWFALHTSRGLDDVSLKIFMRASVLISEYITYIPATVLLGRHLARYQRVSGWEASIALVAVLMQPSTILIDHGHFQYNTVMLGFVAAAAACSMTNHFLWASVFFVSALCFKQMALYYAPVVFAYFLANCFSPRLNSGRFLGIAIVTLASFAVIFLPLVAVPLIKTLMGRGVTHEDALPTPPLLALLNLDSNSIFYQPLLQIAQSVHRIFPFARGLFEDKVANFWCALNTFYKLRSLPTHLLQRLSLAATMLATLPPSIASFVHPRPAVLLPALATSAWAFFLFSFQVHEKSVLLPLFPMTLMLSGDGGLSPQTRAWIVWANILGAWTLYPLLKRDGLQVPYFVLTLFWGWLLGIQTLFSSKSERPGSVDAWSKLLHGSFYAAMLIWHVAEAFIAPPAGKPDLWVVANVLVGAAGFDICYLWCLWRVWVPVLAVTKLPTPLKKVR